MTVGSMSEFILAVIRATAGFCVFGFACDAVDNHFVQGKRALVEFVQPPGFAQACDFHKQCVHIGGDLFVGGNDAEVGVDARCALVVVTRAEVGVTLEYAVFAADDQCHLGVDFVAEHAVHDVRARLFELLRPVDVVGFVKTRHQFDDDGYLFACECRLHQGADEFGTRAVR